MIFCGINIFLKINVMSSTQVDLPIRHSIVHVKVGCVLESTIVRSTLFLQCIFYILYIFIIHTTNHSLIKYIWRNGRTYKGGFSNGKRHGKGAQTWIDGSSYVGSWALDLVISD